MLSSFRQVLRPMTPVRVSQTEAEGRVEDLPPPTAGPTQAALAARKAHNRMVTVAWGGQGGGS